MTRLFDDFVGSNSEPRPLLVARRAGRRESGEKAADMGSEVLIRCNAELEYLAMRDAAIQAMLC